MNDDVLCKSITDALDFDPNIDAANIGVAVEGGITTLTGQVGSHDQKIAAEALAHRIKGVRSIAVEIKLRHPSPKKTADEHIAECAATVIAWDAMVLEDVVHVQVEKGWVSLSGTVVWQFQREAACTAVRRLNGVVGVTNDIAVKHLVRAPA